MDIIINLNKPKGITSQDAVTAVKKILKIKKAGHAGTLDPSATGVLLVCVNKATRLASYFSSLDKEYIAMMKLGETTDTQDLCGSVIEKTDKIDVAEEEIKTAIKSFEGRILQKPPMFSALKHRGKPLYKFARKGIDIPRQLREVFIYKIELLDINLPFITFRTLCSKGTYIRTLCDDIGKKLGTGAHLFELARIAIGNFKTNDAVTLEDLNSVQNQIQELPQKKIRGIYHMDTALSWMPEIKVKKDVVKNVKNGNPLKISDCSDFPSLLKTGDSIKIKSPNGEFLAIGNLVENHRYTFRIDVVFA
ncbi:MAG: tRNA pseudouridine(55) synthase TruB [Nitrospirae bacterium]|nr:tRNA pseudouridine(55) synthase TruB [Nitrospirota bacterium]